MALIVDAGALLAALDVDEEAHESCAEVLRSAAGAPIIPVLVVTEVAHFVERRLGAEVEVRLLADFAAGNFATEPVHASDWERMAELVWQYRDARLGTVDASVVAAAERRGVTTIATLDHRHFRAVRPRHVDAFELVP